jgi:hypothetical protein
MSERIDVLAGATIAGAGGDAVRGKGPALTQWVDAAVLSRHLCRFEALTLALWTVQRAICPPIAPRLRFVRHRLPRRKAGPRTRSYILNDVWRHHMAAHDWYQHVEISDGGRTVAAAEVIISGGSGGTARASLRAESGHIAPGRRASLVDAVLDLPAVRESARLAAVFPLGDSESLHRLEQRCRDVRTRPAGSTAILEADLQPGDDGRAAQDPVGEADPEG